MIIREYIRQQDFKYIRVLGAFLLRLVGQPRDIYQELEPLLSDARKLRYRRPGKSWWCVGLGVWCW